MNTFPSSRSVYEALRASGKPLRRLGITLGGEEIVCAETGGERRPAILVTAGAHSPEVAGVLGGLRILEKIQTEHKTYVIPMRDPFGFNDFDHCLGFLLDQRVTVRSHAEGVALLERYGTVLLRSADFCLALLGEIG